MVSYDISDSTRLRKVFSVMKNYGDHVQYSVFVCELNDREKILLQRDLRAVINHKEDQVLFFRIGSSSQSSEELISSLGRDYQPVCRTVVV